MITNRLCWPSKVWVAGKEVLTTKLLNCFVEARESLAGVDAIIQDLQEEAISARIAEKLCKAPDAKAAVFNDLFGPLWELTTAFTSQELCAAVEEVLNHRRTAAAATAGVSAEGLAEGAQGSAAAAAAAAGHSGDTGEAADQSNKRKMPDASMENITGQRPCPGKCGALLHFKLGQCGKCNAKVEYNNAAKHARVRGPLEPWTGSSSDQPAMQNRCANSNIQKGAEEIMKKVVELAEASGLTKVLQNNQTGPPILHNALQGIAIAASTAIYQHVQENNQAAAGGAPGALGQQQQQAGADARSAAAAAAMAGGFAGFGVAAGGAPGGIA
ncbi:hypothetical protein OEZ86_004341 [Tetradesmus obliquus]|nr:hypothetical protein OEZ86_004341 [Tetradesmus obliquus]